MSWQAYVDRSLVGTGKIDKAAIFSITDESQLASNPGFSATAEEIQSLVQGFDNTGPLWSSGLHIGGQEYKVIKADDRSIYGKKGYSGVCAVKTKQALVVAHYPETVQPGEAAEVTERLANYLVEEGY